MSFEMAMTFVLGITLDMAYEMDPSELSEDEIAEIEEFMDTHEIIDIGGVPTAYEISDDWSDWEE